MSTVKDGSITLEASIVFPVVILVLLPFLYLLRIVCAHIYIQTSVFDTAVQMESILYMTDKAAAGLSGLTLDTGPDASDEEETALYQDYISQLPFEEGLVYGKELASDLILQGLVRRFILEDLDKAPLASLGISDSAYGFSLLLSDFHYAEDGYDNLFRIHVSYQPEFPFAPSFVSLPPAETEAYGRGYQGQALRNTDTTGDRTGRTTETYYRIGSGDHYHTRDCYMIKQDVQKMTRQDAYGKGLQQCSNCKPEQETIVYATTGGRCFHKEDCGSLSPVLHPVTQEMITEQGYRPCQICVGGGEWFG